MSYVASSQALLMPCKHWRWSQMETSGYEASSTMCLPYSGELSRKKTFANWWKIRFSQRRLVDCSLVLPKDTTPPNFMEKSFMNSHKTLKFAKVFSLKSFPLYGILQSGTVIHVTAIEMDHNNCVMLTTFSQLVRADFIDNCVEL